MTELLIVCAIMGALASVTMPALSSLSAIRFTSDLGEISNVFNRARATAMTQNTYTWVLLEAPATPGVDQTLTLSAAQSLNGENDPGATGTTCANLSPLTARKQLTGIVFNPTPANLQTDARPLPAGALALGQFGSVPATTPATTRYVVRFNPRGEAAVESATDGEINTFRFEVHPSASGAGGPKNVAAFTVNRSTGQINFDR